MILKASCHRCRWVFLLSFCLTATSVPAGYKVRPWTPRPIETYPSSLTSEGVTIAAEPLFSDALAAKVFDKTDIVARGIMPLAIVVFNSNDFPVEVEASGIELLLEGEHLRPIPPDEAIQRMFRGDTKRVSVPTIPRLPRIKINKSNDDILQDFQRKFLGIKQIGPRATAGGFLYVPVTGNPGLRDRLAESRVYIRHIYRTDNGADLVFFEIELKAAVESAPRK